MIKPVYVGVVQYSFNRDGVNQLEEEVSRPYSGKGQAKAFITRKRTEYARYQGNRRIVRVDVFVSGPWVVLDD